jgi:hypothetical protein
MGRAKQNALPEIIARFVKKGKTNFYLFGKVSEIYPVLLTLSVTFSKLSICHLTCARQARRGFNLPFL